MINLETSINGNALGKLNYVCILHMYKTSILELNEDDADDYIICYNCKKLTHRMKRSLSDMNHCSINGLGMSSSTVVGECFECHDIRTKEMMRYYNRKRIIFMKRYLEEKGDPKYITIDDTYLTKQLRISLDM